MACACSDGLLGRVYPFDWSVVRSGAVLSCAALGGASNTSLVPTGWEIDLRVDSAQERKAIIHVSGGMPP